tara:strand:+ start:466 stop:840 length:375 start_codon:yes stop_codon:yes gene_type:complete
MGKIIFLFFFLIYDLHFIQSTGEVIDFMIQQNLKDVKGKKINEGLILTDVINENNTTLVYVSTAENKEYADFYKNNQSKSSLINQSPNALSKTAVKYNIIVKWKYYFNNDKILELTVHPREWNK